MKCEDIESRGSSTVDTSISMDVWSSTALYHSAVGTVRTLYTHALVVCWMRIFFTPQGSRTSTITHSKIQHVICMTLELTEITDCSKMVKLYVCEMMTVILFVNTVTEMDFC